MDDFFMTSLLYKMGGFSIGKRNNGEINDQMKE